jgi:tetratricopeptide (TPR) repeat protein
LFIRAAKEQLLSLYNGLGEYDKSQALLQEMISEARNSKEKMQLYDELGTVSRARFWTSQSPIELEKSQEAFEQANTLYRSLPPEQQSGDIGGQQIVGLRIAATAAREANNHEKSATLFRSARELFQSSPESAKHAVLLGDDLEIITEQEMIEWIHIRKEADALKCLEILTHLPSFRWSPSYYALNYAALWYEKDSKGFQDFVSNWLDKNPFDERTPILMARLGFSYFDDGLYDKVLPIYETLRDKHRADFQRLEPKAFQQGNGGHYERILHDLFKIYSQRGDRNKAENMMSELTALLPDSTLGKSLSRQDFSYSEAWTPPERGRYLVLRIVSFVAGIVMILWGLYLAWTKEKK